MTKALMFQGTGSHVGKTVFLAGLARVLTRQGKKVVPFKPQNMSNNAAITKEGKEIGRAQALQAIACGVDSSCHMNPVLLKPQSQNGSQIIVQGKLWGTAKAREYQTLKSQLIPYVLESYQIMSEQADIILIEGAGSAAEINLRQHDIANMGFAQLIRAPVIIVGDIDRGGVIASLIGIHTILPPKDLELIKGFIINKMRGDLSLFHDARQWIEQKTQWQDCGLLPHFHGLDKLPDEDSFGIKTNNITEIPTHLNISVLQLPSISNFDDFDPLRIEANVNVNFIPIGQPVPKNTHVIIIPGSKATINDLKALIETGWDIDIKHHLRMGGYIMGICGGYQMLGNTIIDETGIEGEIGATEGLKLLAVLTKLTPNKCLVEKRGVLFTSRARCSGYEMHLGQTFQEINYTPFVTLEGGKPEGVVSNNGQIIGTYLHGIFNYDDARAALIKYFGGVSNSFSFYQTREDILNRWADHIEAYVNIERLMDFASLSN